MLRRLALLGTTALLGFTVACGPNSSSSNAAGSGTSASASASPGTCPTANTESFAKTRFVADAVFFFVSLKN